MAMHIASYLSTYHVSLLIYSYNVAFISCVLIKALSPICMKYTAQGESQVANVAWAEWYICHETATNSCILSYKRSGSAIKMISNDYS